MNVLIATAMQYPHIGGASTHIAALGKKLSSRATLAGVAHGGCVSLSVGDALRITASRLAGRDIARARKLAAIRGGLSRHIARQCNGWNRGVIHCHDPLATCAALDVRRPGMAVVQTVHGPWSKENQTGGTNTDGAYGRLISEVEREAFFGADLLLAVDSGQAAILGGEHGVPAERIRIIENAVDTDALADTRLPCASAGLPRNYFVVPRRLVPKNGVEFALRAMAILNGADTHLLVAGDGPLRISLQALARQLGMARRVRFLGDVSQHELFPMIKAARAVIVPSVPACGVIEATSLSVLETMAIGTPVIASALGGIAEIMGPPGLGILAPPGDPAALAAAMETVLRFDEPTRQRITVAALARVQSAFGADRWIGRIMAAYEEALACRSVSMYPSSRSLPEAA